MSEVSPLTQVGFNQAELVQGESKVLYLSGQTAMSADGRPQHAGDGIQPPSTLLGVLRLAFAEFMVEFEATAVS